MSQDDKLIHEAALDIALWFSEDNNEKAREVVQKVMRDIDLSQYVDVNQQVMVAVYVRQGNDIISHWGSFSMRSSAWAAIFDLLTFENFVKGTVNFNQLSNTSWEDWDDEE